LDRALHHYQVDPDIMQAAMKDLQEIMESPEGQDLFSWWQNNNPSGPHFAKLDGTTKAVFMRAHA
jgi:hypothetical protein